VRLSSRQLISNVVDLVLVRCFYEALRLYPIVRYDCPSANSPLTCISKVNAVPKRAAEDTFITSTRADPDDPETASVLVKKGTQLTLQIGAVHYNR
jgi:hypothetical protein